MNDIIRVEPTPKEVELTGTTSSRLAAAKALKIETDDDAKNAADMAKQLSSAIKGLNEERLAITKPFRDGVEAINARFKKLEDTLTEANTIVRNRLLEHQQLREAEAKEAREEQARLDAQRAEEARVQAEKEEAERAANSPKSQASDASPSPAMPEIAPVFIAKAPPKVTPVRVRSEGGAVASIKKVWKARVTNVAALAQSHPDLVTPDLTAITKRMREAFEKDGTIKLELPGVEFYQEDQLGVR